MRIFLTSLVASAVFPTLVWGQAGPPNIPVTRLTIKAAEAPIPSLRYELLPNLRERTAGNAAQAYLQAVVLHYSLHAGEAAKERNDRDRKIDEMMSRPSKEIKVEELKNYLKRYAKVLREVDAAVVRDQCDWELERRFNADGIGALMPEVQKMRELARLLRIRTQIHITEGKTAEGLHDIKRGLAMARHVGEGPSLIQWLIGAAIFQMFAAQLDRALELPDCPNLYWSLTALPRPFFDMHKPLDGEMRTMEAMLPQLGDLEKPMSAEQARKILEYGSEYANSSAPQKDEDAATSRLRLAALVTLRHPAAREKLLRLGKTEAELDAMPAAQIVLLESSLDFRALRDEMHVSFHLPYLEARKGLAHVDKKMRQLDNDTNRDAYRANLSLLLSTTRGLHASSVRSDRRIALLRTIEALRMHAAAAGAFPDKLAAIVVVPLPDDPVAGRPFAYELTKEGKAVLTAPPPDSNPGNALKYEVTLAK
jgi:hypothetical protein